MLSATIGIAAFPGDASHVDDLVSKADLALYRGKRNGRRQVVMFDPDMLADERHVRFIERELRAAILMNEIELFYQPIFGADGATLRSYEALVRWNHPVRGMISPADFVPIAEQSDLIDMLGEWVIRRACTDLDALGIPVSVNVSSNQLRRAEFAGRFAEIVAETGASGSQLIAEITETVPLNAGAVERANIDALRALGVRIAIDDFGAGHASLQYLRAIPFDVLKIDRSYTAELESRQVDGAIIAAICTIARAIKVDVIAEGVETEAQLKLLQAAGCTAFQGFLLGRPLPLWKLRGGAALTRAA
jgi:EAL domain-containing protein (putative c-di-GMP-specific phosphodiesterase class I)